VEAPGQLPSLPPPPLKSGPGAECDVCCCVAVSSCSDSPDFIVVRDGPDASSPVIAQFCNRQRDEQLVSSGRHLCTFASELRFGTDASFEH